MKKIIEIKIECKGHAVGTLGWFNSIISGTELVIKETKSGIPGMFYRTETEDGKKTLSFICKKWNDNCGDPSNYAITDDNIVHVYPVSNGYVYGMFDEPLTEACECKVKEFIDLAVQKYREWWESDGKQ
jgi:hypothetical protein